jgi:hypothetical protein
MSNEISGIEWQIMIRNNSISEIDRIIAINGHAKILMNL